MVKLSTFLVTLIASFWGASNNDKATTSEGDHMSSSVALTVTTDTSSRVLTTPATIMDQVVVPMLMNRSTPTPTRSTGSFWTIKVE